MTEPVQASARLRPEDSMSSPASASASESNIRVAVDEPTTLPFEPVDGGLVLSLPWAPSDYVNVLVGVLFALGGTVPVGILLLVGLTMMLLVASVVHIGLAVAVGGLSILVLSAFGWIAVGGIRRRIPQGFGRHTIRNGVVRRPTRVVASEVQTFRLEGNPGDAIGVYADEKLWFKRRPSPNQRSTSWTLSAFDALSEALVTLGFDVDDQRERDAWTQWQLDPVARCAFELRGQGRASRREHPSVFGMEVEADVRFEHDKMCVQTPLRSGVLDVFSPRLTVEIDNVHLVAGSCSVLLSEVSAAETLVTRVENHLRIEVWVAVGTKKLRLGRHGVRRSNARAFVGGCEALCGIILKAAADAKPVEGSTADVPDALRRMLPTEGDTTPG